MLAYETTSLPAPEIKRVGFKVLSADEIRRMSVVQVTETTLYNRGLPAINGVNDHRMGTVDRRVLCGTCGGDMTCCQGHQGHIELAFPVYHSAFFDTVYRVLKCVCFMCARVCAEGPTAASGEDLEVDVAPGRRRLLEAYAASKSVRRCPHCAAPRPQYSKGSCAIKLAWPDDAAWQSDEEREYCTRPFTAREALSILRNMPEESARQLGFDPAVSKPESLILTVLLVPPPATRPSIVAAEGSKTRGQDDLTTKLQEIVKRSADLRAALGDEEWMEADMSSPDRQERLQRLQFEVFTLVNNSVRGQRPSTQRSGVPTKSLFERIKGKDGRIRGNLMGKRVDFSARSVISPGPLIGLDEVGVPLKIALLETVPERVTRASAERLRARVRAGPGRIDGAECVISPEGALIQLAQCADRSRLNVGPGWTVERYLENGDVVIFNRQPSLHKMGMMGHRVRLVEGLTFRLNLSVTAPYNADFDGDEMNLHVPQSAAARASVLALMMVGDQVLAPQANKPCIGLVQDTLLGCYAASRPGELFGRADAAHVVAQLKHARRERLPPPCVRLRGVPYWTGKQLFSLLVAPCVCVDRWPQGSALVELGDEPPALIAEGELLGGPLDKSILGSASGGIIDMLCREASAGAVARFVEDAQRFSRAFLALRGFNVGISDCVLRGDGDDRVAERIAVATRLADDITREAEGASPADAEVAESTIRHILSKALTQTGAIVEASLSRDNAIRTMVTCGSKGSPINLSQIGGCVGQQSVDGKRICAEKGSRTLPCFQFGERSLASRGFVQSSYSRGLEPYEFFFHAMGGREGLVDTAVKTATTGYIQRRLVKAMESHTVHYDGTVRNASDEVVQFVYAGSGFDPSALERVPLKHMEASVAELERRLGVADGRRAAELRARLLPSVVRLGCGLVERCTLPFSPERLRKRWLRRPARTDAERRRAKLATGRFVQEVGTWPSVALRYTVVVDCPSTLLERHLAEDIDALLAQARERLEAARVAAGEMVGCIAAQSIGEPTTQMTLNTFHYAGVGAKNVTLGIPRLQELLTLSKSMRSPSLTLRFREPFASAAGARGAAFAAYMADTLPLCTLADIVLDFDVIDDPHPTRIESDSWMVEVDAALEPPPDDMSDYVARIRLNEPAMRARRLAPPDVRRLLRERLRGKAHVVSSERNDIEWVVRVRLLHVARMVAAAGAHRDREAVITHRCVASVMATLSVGGCASVCGATARTETAHRIVAGELRMVEEHVVDTAGGGLADMAIVPVLDWSRCQTNDVLEVHALLGIEATARVLYDELHSVISFDGTYVFPGHLLMIVDTMTRDGWLKALNRFGINRDGSSALARSSFEETPEVLTDAAVYAERGEARGVSTRIILGQPAHVGTGVVDVLFHRDMLPPKMVRELTRRTGVVRSKVRPPAGAAPRATFLPPIAPSCVSESHLLPYTTPTEEPTDQPAEEAGAPVECYERAPSKDTPFAFHSPPPSDEDE